MNAMNAELVSHLCNEPSTPKNTISYTCYQYGLKSIFLTGNKEQGKGTNEQKKKKKKKKKTRKMRDEAVNREKRATFYTKILHIKVSKDYSNQKKNYITLKNRKLQERLKFPDKRILVINHYA